MAVLERRALAHAAVHYVLVWVGGETQRFSSLGWATPARGLCAVLNAILCLPGEFETVKYYSRLQLRDSPLVKY